MNDLDAIRIGKMIRADTKAMDKAWKATKEGSPEREALRQQSRDRLISAGILTKSGKRLAKPYRWE